MQTKNPITSFLLLLSLFAVIVLSDADYVEPEKRQGLANSQVEISVGQENGPYRFVYYVDGYTYSPGRISISGDYFDNNILQCGHTSLFLDASTGISKFRFTRNDQPNELIIYIESYDYYYSQVFEYYYRVRVPGGLDPIFDTYRRQINATALVVSAPSYSSRLSGFNRNC